MHRSGLPGRRVLAFRDIKDINAAWRSVLHLASRRRCVKGEHVQLGSALLFLERGRMRLMHQSPEGAEKILWYIREGCVFGETAFFDPGTVDYYCFCMSACTIFAFCQEQLTRINREHPDLMLNLLRTMARKGKMLASQASSLSLDSVLVRICKFLSQRITPEGTPALTAKIGISKQEMASLLGVHRISLYRVLRQQEEQGLFGPVKGDSITILRPHDFYRLAGM